MIVFISATGTNVGKTHITNLIAKNLRTRAKIIISKPIETGVTNFPEDALAHAKLQNMEIDEICFYQFELPSAPFIADKNGIIDIKFILRKLHELESSCDILLVEGAGGLFVPIKKDYFMIDLISDLGAFCVLVSDSSLGCINHILSAREILDSRNIDFITVVNVFNMDDFVKISYDFLKDLQKNFISPSQDAQIADFLLSRL